MDDQTTILPTPIPAPVADPFAPAAQVAPVPTATAVSDPVVIPTASGPVAGIISAVATPIAAAEPQLAAAAEQMVTDGVEGALAGGVSGVIAAETKDVKAFWQSKTLITILINTMVGLGSMVGIALNPNSALLVSIIGGALTLTLNGLTALFHAISTKAPV